MPTREGARAFPYRRRAAASLLFHASNSDIKYRSYLPHVYWTVSVAEEDQELIGPWVHLVPSNLSNLLALPKSSS